MTKITIDALLIEQLQNLSDSAELCDASGRVLGRFVPVPALPRVHRIIDRGRGPEIAGTRITVYDILDYLEAGWHHTTIAAFFRLSSAQVQVAIQYIKEHRDEVMADYQQILERLRGNPPEVQAKLDAIHAKYQVLWADRLRAAQEEANGESAPE